MSTLVKAPVIFLGPSAPEQDVLSVLPDAVIRPPVRRGDLYRYRILKHSLFVIIDGVFASTLAVSPREVVDVIRDGATVVGASSMGALRAADCAPAGAVGMGLIYRLFRRRAISSEVEVAVSYHEDRPFPCMTVPLVNMRIALRRAVRKGLMDPEEADRVIRTASAQNYRERTWRSAFSNAGITPAAGTQDYIRAIDAKREDARLAFRRVAERRSRNSAFQGAPRPNQQVFGLLGEGRERAPDPAGGADHDGFVTDFIHWLVISGQFRQLRLPEGLARIDEAGSGSDLGRSHVEAVWEGAKQSTEFDALLMRFNIFRRAVSEARELGLAPDRRDVGQAETDLIGAHGAATWDALIMRADGVTKYRESLEGLRDMLAMTKCLRRHLFTKSGNRGRRPSRAALWR